HANGGAVDVQVDVQRGAGLASIHGQVDVADVQHRAPREQGIAVVTVVALHGRAGDGVKAKLRGEKLHLHRRAGLAGTRIDLLQADDVGVDLTQYAGDACGIARAVRTDALVDVVRGDAKALRVRGHRRSE